MDDARIIGYAIFNKVDYIFTYNRKHLKDKEGEIASFVGKYRLSAPKIVVPGEEESKELSSSTFFF